MKIRYLTLAILTVLNLFLAASPYIPYVNKIWAQPDLQGFYSTFATYVGVMFLLLTVAIAIVLIQEGQDLRAFREQVIERMNGAVVKPTRDTDFYKDFAAACLTADFSVAISYFRPHPPEYGGRAYQNEYYKKHFKIVKDTPNVTFRRLVRDTNENRDWIKSLLTGYQGKNNAHLAILKDRDAEDEMGLAISVQVVDEAKVWFVALKSHQPDGQFRDLYVENKDLAIAMKDYYERIWNLSVVLLRDGQLTNDGRDFLA